MINGKYLMLGSNMGDRISNLKKALKLIEEKFDVIKTSEIYETAAWGFEEQQNFFNQAIEIQTDVSPKSLLKFLLGIELQMGRIRNNKWGARVIDIDILYYDDVVINSEDLIIPHPYIPNRRFTLIPLVEIAPNAIHPVLNKSNHTLLLENKDKLSVKKFS